MVKEKKIVQNKNKKNLQNFLKEVIGIVAGKPSEDIVELLYAKNYINEFLLAKKLDITINQTRNILYKISDKGLVSNIRKKDKKKGWYTYFWKLEVLKSLEFLRSVLNKKISHTTSHVKSRETKRFFVCERCNIELGEENALIYNFTCQECGAIFTLKDNAKLLRELDRNLLKYKRELELVEEEIKIEEEKFEKERQKLRKPKKKVVKKKPKPKKRKFIKKAVKRKVKKKSVKKKGVRRIVKKFKKKKLSKKIKFKRPVKKIKDKKRKTKKLFKKSKKKSRR